MKATREKMITMARATTPRNVVVYLLVGLATTLLAALLLGLSPMSTPACTCPSTIQPSHLSSPSQHRLAVLVPFRDRFDELLDFVPHMSNFLRNLDHHIFVLNQVDHFRFNRASLINSGFSEVREHYDYIAMHDVDLLPLNPELSYSYPSEGPFHVASPSLHPRYHYPTFVGGILLISRQHFTLVNGMSNKYWGWGLEDDEFYVRLKDAGLTVHRPANLSSGTKHTFKHNHERSRRKRDMTKCYKQQEITRKRDRKTGLADVKYAMKTKRLLTIDGHQCTVLDIALQCDRELTPWCDCSDAPKT
ncbi:hypothetical protein B566_EDAN002107 [Ephemera danica]|nr:hypothetical protein B566_EDAN002107 [Ephemera danica]